jgi:hypothetical protein
MLAVRGTVETSPWKVRRFTLINHRKFVNLLKANPGKFGN